MYLYIYIHLHIKKDVAVGVITLVDVEQHSLVLWLFSGTSYPSRDNGSGTGKGIPEP